MANLRQAAIFGALAVVVLGLAFGLVGGLVFAGDNAGHAAWILLWPGLVYLFLGLGYLTNDASGLFGKDKTTGQIPMWRKIFFLPYLAPMRAIWWTRHRYILNENPYDKVAPDMYVGRFCMDYDKEFPKDATVVIDLTAEFGQNEEVLKDRQYFLLPALDCTMPPADELLNLARTLSNLKGKQMMYIHCANGHGRSSSLAAVIMLVRGTVVNWQDAFETMRQYRPLINIQPAQERVLDRCQAMLSIDGAREVRSENHDADVEPGEIELVNQRKDQ